MRTICLDAGGVFLNPNWERVSEALAAEGILVPAADLAAAEPYAKRELDVPHTIVSTRDESRGWLYFDLVLERVGIAPSGATRAALAVLREYHRLSNLWESVPPGAAETIRRFRARGLSVVVVSNANGTLQAHLKRLGLDPLFDAVLDSQDEGVEKPDPEIFRRALERVGGDPSTSLHVGDFYEIDVVGARAAGLRVALIDPAGLYESADVPRFRDLPALADALESGLTGSSAARTPARPAR